MADYIERNSYVGLFKGEHNPLVWEEIEEFMDSIPSADVAPVVHGKWIIRDRKRYLISCSNCNWINVHGKFDYCPICGAKMDGEV